MFSLNINAPSFHPTFKIAKEAKQEPTFGLEENITPEELEELEECERWVEEMAYYEEIEQEHLIAFALQEAPPEVVKALEAKYA
mmetsp:Transcript_21552/g.38513  ORF Transcript_21552/g.38513 Transcript_21552/m.38513 type:complete len:84 (+) Transcript_21552:110-361(+)|eukprot:CAMPEP_0175054338 /NCGR_PEP_ID=MMETSP0052_2-20121109/9448_1 /TAXON_ID=51329 ORGANISM="Polytomella parva, Strain SAG 63-3" /NCGR_SAMPLE_ID=MMETSP0052_2 /ASSEMBLY_ACC=CAM_ASM_000194 /LENGTH=83 /DNA_ID=CAMNT_0016319019 /DNA_START=103 /DNA_END=354 /DNA_ORIENTATION=-